MSAGARRQRLLMQKRGEGEDEYGNPQSDAFATVFETTAELIPMKGSEPVIAARLTGTQPYVVRIPSCAAARDVTTAWRIVDKRDPFRIFNITSVADMDQKNRTIDILATQGEAA
ncbi:head-tail adaptor [Rhizobium sp. NFR07]|uniref:head-tail adaptor protein n=1 Tax=Rhizobium sp. NFR07 TaxID=1566262 RepID=UPI0008EF73D6|nr:head-tail adaptor protein [Rhizobium sp. NFR07]SFB52294.1 head-tail adaptor [Rhizobium sp. NFR07]